MTEPSRTTPDTLPSFRSPSGHMMAGEVIACFLLRLSRHRRVMRLAARLTARRAEDRA
jgi:hypothetical protein